MKRDKVIVRLGLLKTTLEECRKIKPLAFIEDDIIAVDIAIRTVKSDRRAKTSFYKGVCITTIVFMLLIATDLFFKSYWGY